MSNQFAMSFPAISGGVVMQGHADYCAENGHATHTVNREDGTVHFVSPNCPRCGVSIRSQFDMRKAWQFIVDSYDSGFSPIRADWTDAEILGFVAEHHVDGIKAVFSTETTPSATHNPKETEGFKAMKAQGVEFTSKSFPEEDRGKLFVSFKTETIAAEIAAQLTADGFDVTVCPNPAWIKIVGTWS